MLNQVQFNSVSKIRVYTNSGIINQAEDRNKTITIFLICKNLFPFNFRPLYKKMNWIILIIVGLFEIAFAYCLGKVKETTGNEMYMWYVNIQVYYRSVPMRVDN